MLVPKVFKWRKISLPIVGLIFHLLKLNPFRNKEIWLFGCWCGLKYDDNSKYLFEYVNENHKKIRCIWLTRNAEIAEKIRALGYEAYTAFSLKGILASLHGGVAFMTNGIDDFGIFPLIGGTKIVSLWHGVGGFKKIYNENYSGFKLKVKKSVDAYFNWTYRNFSLATSKYTAERTVEQFGVKPSSVVITGQPRNDLFKRPIDRKHILKNIKIDDDMKIVLYMPTYRIDPITNEDVVKNILDKIYANKLFNDFLVREKFFFLVKLHPLTKFEISNESANIKILSDKDVLSVQHLLMCADCLVSDYSSCCVDYALLNKRIVFFVPDEKSYLSYSSLNDAYSRVVKEKARTINDLIESLKINNLDQTKMLNDLFEDDSIKGTCYCENMYRKVCERYFIGNV